MPLFFRIAAALGLALAAMAFGTQAALAGGVNTIIVTTTADGLNEFDGQCSLREAIHNVRLALAYSPLPGECAAGSTTALNRIVLASGETYSLTSPWTSADTGRLSMHPNWESDQVQLRIETSAEAPATILQTVFGNYVFENRNARTELHNLIITGGAMSLENDAGAGIQNVGGQLLLQQVRVVGNSAPTLAGGILNAAGAELILVDSTIELNDALQGGGVYNTGSSRVELYSTLVRANSGGRGGGIYNAGELYIGPGSSFNLNVAFVDGTWAGGAIFNDAGASLEIEGTAFQGNLATAGRGGAIAALSGPLFRIDDSEFIENGSGPDQKQNLSSDPDAVRGGGSFNQSGGAIAVDTEGSPVHLQIQRSVFRDNRSAGAGGAIFTNTTGLVEISESAFELNRAQGSAGGAIFTLNADLQVTSSLFTGNLAHSAGGAISSSGDGTLLIEHARFFDNGQFGGDFPMAGGAVNCGGFTRQCLVRFSRFEQNQSFNGGAMFMTAGSTSELVGNLFTANSAENWGGALFITDAAATFANTTISGNSALVGGGIYIASTADVTGINLSIVGNLTGQDIVKRGTMRLQNSLIVTPGQDNCLSDLGNLNFISLGNNISNDDSCLGLDGPGDLINTDPLVDFQLTNLGGNTLVHPLLPGSPALDAGNDAACQAAPVSGLDQRGGTRPAVGCDIGALEQGFIFDRIFSDRFEFAK